MEFTESEPEANSYGVASKPEGRHSSYSRELRSPEYFTVDRKISRGNISLNEKPINTYITPLTPYIICNHFISTEIHNTTSKFVGYALDGKYIYDYSKDVKANDLLRNQNYHDIQDFDIIQVQVDSFDFFYDRVLPILSATNKHVILITSQWHLPQIHRNAKTDHVITHPNIVLWISQNPIYTNELKYMAFPYGLIHHDLDKYVAFMKSHHSLPKSIPILNPYASVHPGLSENHIRNTVDMFGKNNGSRLDYHTYLTNIADSEFVISTAGDRDDCYRHYECIGLGAIPVSNIDGEYRDIFGENMIYSNAEEMVHMVETNNADTPFFVPDSSVVSTENGGLTTPNAQAELRKSLKGRVYHPPNRDILTISYWLNRIDERIAIL